MEGVGSSISFRRVDNPKFRARLFKKHLLRGLTNCARGEISGRTNLKNVIMEGEFGNRYQNLFANWQSWTIRDGGGGFRRFQTREGSKVWITNAELPSGSTLHYKVQNTAAGVAVTEVKELSPLGRELGKLIFSYPSSSQYRKNPHMIAYGSNGTHVKYEMGSIEFSSQNLLTKVEPSFAPYTEYHYHEVNFDLRTPTRVVRKERPEGRFVEIEYYKRNKYKLYGHKFFIGGPEDPRFDRVKSQKAPLGRDATPINAYTFLYTIHPHGMSSTEVYNAHHQKTVYLWNQRQRLSAVEQYEGPNLYSKERIFWGKEEDISNLSSRLVEDSHKNILICRAYRYDPHGNITQDELWGDLTGNNTIPISIDEHGRPHSNGCEAYFVQRKYTHDGRNLLLHEDDGRKAISRVYGKSHDRPLAEYLKVLGVIKKRTFYSYDPHGNLIEEILDDGMHEESQDMTGVTTRFIKRIKVAEIPFGMPAIVDEMAWDPATGQELLIKSAHNTYNLRGLLERQEIYGSDGTYAYACEWKYDDHGNVIQEIDPLGQITTRQFDANDNLIKVQGPRLDVHHIYHYDFSNRLIGEEEVHASGFKATKQYRYDYLNQLIGETDIYGNETLYFYDELGRKTTISLPFYRDVYGNPAISTKKMSYTTLGALETETDGLGATTKYRHNIRGKVTDIDFPDGTKECYRYFLDGPLMSKVTREGNSHFYEYDYLQRLIKEEIRDQNGTSVGTISKTYNAWNLLTETDLDGSVTSYNYDPYGRVISVVKGSKRTEFSYDRLGKLFETKCFYGDQEYIAKQTLYDLLEES